MDFLLNTKVVGVLCMKCDTNNIINIDNYTIGRWAKDIEITTHKLREVLLELEDYQIIHISNTEKLMINPNIYYKGSIVKLGNLYNIFDNLSL